MPDLTVDELEQMVAADCRAQITAGVARGDEWAVVAQTIVAAMGRDDWATVAKLEPQLDAHDWQPPTILSAALWYAEQGLRVFPLQARSQIPHKGTHGVKEATSDRDRIIAWWRRWPESNLAIATGHLVDVIDVDGMVGINSLTRLEHTPQTLGVVLTPRPGGQHHYISATGRGNGAGIFPAIDFRGLGGYVVAPPSLRASAKTYPGCPPLKPAERYRWLYPLQLPDIAKTAA